MRRVAVVTGAGRGIGRAIAESLSSDTAVVGLDVEFPSDTPWLAETLPADVSDSVQVRRAVDAIARKFTRLDIVVCAAGIIRDRVSWKMTDDDWSAVIDVNLTGVFNVLRAAATPLRETSNGRIVIVGSINGMRGRFGQINYAAAKAGLTGVARTLALELARDGITVNVVAPGFIDTDMTLALPEEVRRRAVERTPLGRMGSPSEVAALVRFLTGDDASFITGAVIPVDGGQLLGQVA